jgi:pimeloyl-ACP methyl ester carboxylesterase
MNPVYFGSSQEPLFGIYHTPQMRGPCRACCIVLCYPMAHEYVYVHRAFAQLATRLARTGFHVFRFDYYGFGDSSGDSEESDIDQWIENISTAIDEIKSICALAKVSLIGLRLGATASVLAAAGRNDVESLVLWEPIINGSKYIEDLYALHSKWVHENLPSNRYLSLSDRNLEIIGIPFFERLRSGLEKIDLTKLQKHLAKNILIIENNKHINEEPFRAILKELGVNIQCQQMPAPDAWTAGAGMNTHYVPSHTLNFIVSWISSACT